MDPAIDHGPAYGARRHAAARPHAPLAAWLDRQPAIERRTGGLGAQRRADNPCHATCPGPLGESLRRRTARASSMDCARLDRTGRIAPTMTMTMTIRIRELESS